MLSVCETTTLDLLTYLERLEDAVQDLDDAGLFALMAYAVSLRPAEPDPERVPKALPALRVIE